MSRLTCTDCYRQTNILQNCLIWPIPRLYREINSLNPPYAMWQLFHRRVVLYLVYQCGSVCLKHYYLTCIYQWLGKEERLCINSRAFFSNLMLLFNIHALDWQTLTFNIFIEINFILSSLIIQSVVSIMYLLLYMHL